MRRLSFVQFCYLKVHLWFQITSFIDWNKTNYCTVILKIDLVSIRQFWEHCNVCSSHISNVWQASYHLAWWREFAVEQQTFLQAPKYPTRFASYLVASSFQNHAFVTSWKVNYRHTFFLKNANFFWVPFVEPSERSYFEILYPVLIY